MLPYLYVYIITMIALFFYDIKVFRQLFLFLAIIFISSLYYLRDYSIGLDTYTYVDIINNVYKINSIEGLLDYSLNYNLEIGFIFFIYIFSLFGVNPSLIFFASAFVIYFNLSRILKEIEVSSILYFSAFFSYCAIFFWTFNILRQMIALSFVVLATCFLLRKSQNIFFIFIFIASLFHYSALFCILFYFIWKYLKFFFNYRWLIVGVICISSKFLLMALVPLYPRYSSYGSGDGAAGIGIFLFIFYFCVFLFSGVFSKNIKFYEIYYRFFISIFSIYIGLQLAFMINGISTFGTTRILLYFLWPVIFIIGIFLINLKKDYRYVINCLFFVFLTLYFIYSLNSAGYEYIPFRFLVG